MKNKKGFTLVELMAVIVVLAIVIAIAVPTYGKIKKSIDRKNYENKVSLIKVAAAKFAEDTNITATFVKELIEQGYLQADDEEGHIYGMDKDYNKIILDCFVVLSERKDGLFYSDFIEKDYSDSSEGNESVCDYNIPNKLTTNFKIEMYDGSLNNTLEYNDDKKWWTKNNVILKTIFANGENNEVTWYEGYGEEEIAKCIGGENNVCVDTNDSKILYVNSNSVLQQNYTAKSTDKDGNPVIARVRVYIDKIQPSFYQNHADKINDKWSSSTIDYKVSAYDNESGLYGFNDETIEGQECPTDFSDYKRGKKISFNSNGKKHLCLVDNVGNTSDTTFEVTHIDKTKMQCNFSITNNPTPGEKVGEIQWYKSNVNLEMRPVEIGESGVMLGKNTENKEIYQTPNYILKSQQSQAVISESITSNSLVSRYGFVKNQAGTKGTCNINFGVETNITAPVSTSYSTTLIDATVIFDKGKAVSGIKETKCYRTGDNQEWNDDGTGIEGELVNDSCYFKNMATAGDQSYKVKKCITSNAGNYICSGEVSITITGSCNEVDETDTSDYSCGAYGACSDSCGGTQYATKNIVTTKTSKYNKGFACGPGNKTVADGCSKACGGVNPTPIEGTMVCNNICGGNYETPLTYKSLDRTKDCPTPKGAESKKVGTTCGGTKVSSSTPCSAPSCPTACGQPSSTQTGTKTESYVSTINPTVSCGSKKVSCTRSCSATAACCTTVLNQTNGTATFNNSTAGSTSDPIQSTRSYTLKNKSLHYSFKVKSVTAGAGGCQFVISTDKAKTKNYKILTISNPHRANGDTTTTTGMQWNNSTDRSYSVSGTATFNGKSSDSKNYYITLSCSGGCTGCSSPILTYDVLFELC